MLLDGILENNRRFVTGREPRPLPPPETLRLAVVGCYDPRLDPILPAALGLDTQKAFFLRAAGAVVRPEGDPLRSLALAAYLFGIDEVLVVGHTSCRMAAFSSAAFIEAFRARGVAREAFGSTDLREWAGAIPDPKRGVVASVAAIAGAACLPGDLTVTGLVLDDTTGALQVVVPPVRRGAAFTVSADAPAAEGAGDGMTAGGPGEAAAHVAAAPSASSRVAAPPAATAAPPPPPAPQPGVPAAAQAGGVTLPPEVAREIEAIRSFVGALERSAGWRDQLARLRADVERQPRPAARLDLIEKFLQRSTTNARGVAAAYDRLRNQTAESLRGPALDRVLDLFRSRGGTRRS
jgi:carbonic anhydrase